jgi:hypothetical protein
VQCSTEREFGPCVPPPVGSHGRARCGGGCPGVSFDHVFDSSGEPVSPKIGRNLGWPA